MSTNPFRRSSLKGPGGSSGGIESPSLASASINTSDTGSVTPPTLSVNTKVSNTTQKHVNFASPPAVPISPVSYPESPESTRFSPAYTFTTPALSTPIGYSSATQSNPLHPEAEYDDDDRAIEQALQNAKANTNIVAPTLELTKQDAVKNTLSRFASVPKRPADTNNDIGTSQPSAPQRQTMDVDAFKRLLLTGDRGSGRGQDDMAHNTTPHTAFVINDNSSATDTASLSQRSLFDPGPPTDDSPRSSNEIDAADAEPIRRSLAQNDTLDSRRKPPPPAPRHGKHIKEEKLAEPLPVSHPDDMSQPSTPSRKPPTPPIARRRSQNNPTPPPTSSRKSSSSELEQPTRLADGGSRAPPPPKPRRPVTIVERRSSSDLPTTQEETNITDSPLPADKKTSDSRPVPPPARNSFKRVSVGNMNPPPVPAPRRGRGSSKSSVESQGPSLTAILGNTSNTELTGEDDPGRGSGSRKASSSSNANDILADLAALQRDVEEARTKSSR